MNLSHPLKWLVLAVMLGACSSPEYDHMTFELRTTPPVPVTVSNSQITIPVGIAMLVKALPISAGSQGYTASDDMALTSGNESILGVREADRITHVVLFGVSPGKACIRVEVNGKHEDCISVRVVENPGLSGSDDEP